MKIDMNPHSITMRIKKTSELRRLCIALGGDRLKERLQDDQIRTNKGLVQQIVPNPQTLQLEKKDFVRD